MKIGTQQILGDRATTISEDVTGNTIEILDTTVIRRPVALK